jgi:DNA-binding transcriptional ArsR family regulator
MNQAERELKVLDGVIAALAHPTRRQILLILQARGGEMTAGDIADRFSCRWPTVSRHLRVLVGAGLVNDQKIGRERVYQLNRHLLIRTVRKWLSWFEPDE